MPNSDHNLPFEERPDDDAISFLLAHNNPQEIQTEIDLIKNEGGLSLQGIMHSGQECLDTIQKNPPDAILVSLELPDMTGVQLAQMVELREPHVAVILQLNGEEREETWHEILQAGVRDFVFQPIQPSLLVNAIQKAVASKRRIRPQVPADSTAERAGGGNLIVFTSPCRGTGQTLLAVNTGICLAEAGSTVLVDLHLPMGDVAIHFDIHPKRSLADLVNAYGGIDQTLLEAIIEKTRSGVNVLAAPSSPLQTMEEQMDVNLVDELIRTLRRMYRYVVVDAPPPRRQETQLLLSQCHRVISTTKADLPRLLQMKTALSDSGELFHYRSILTPVVILDRKSSEIKAVDIPQLVGHPHPSTLPFDHPTAIRSINLGKPLCNSRIKRGLPHAIQKWVKSLQLEAQKKR